MGTKVRLMLVTPRSLGAHSEPLKYERKILMSENSSGGKEHGISSISSRVRAQRENSECEQFANSTHKTLVDPPTPGR